MVVDTSAIAAILFDEPHSAGMIEAMEAAPIRLLSVASLVEATLVVEGRKGPQAQGCEAFRTYGKGRHAAGLNLGDCFAYALAKATGEPLLFKRDDFTRTDIAAA